MDTPPTDAMIAVIDELVKQLTKGSPTRTSEPLSQADRNAIQATINDLVKPFMLTEIAMGVKEPLSRLVGIEMLAQLRNAKEMVARNEGSLDKHPMMKDFSAIIEDIWKPLQDIINHVKTSCIGLLKMVKSIEKFLDENGIKNICNAVDIIGDRLVEVTIHVPEFSKDLSRLVPYIKEYIFHDLKEEEFSAAVNDIVKTVMNSVKYLEESLDKSCKIESFDATNDIVKSLIEMLKQEITTAVNDIVKPLIEKVSRIEETLDKTSKEEIFTAVIDIVKPMIEKVSRIEETLDKNRKEEISAFVNDIVSRIEKSIGKSSEEESFAARTQDNSS